MNIQFYQKLTLLDFPGKTAATIFTYGCNLRCPFCHNSGLVIYPPGQAVEHDEIFSFLEKRKKLLDGVCITGGEPLLQTEFVKELFRLCHDNGVNTCLDTSGSVLNDEVCALLDVTDRVLLDIKYTSNTLYRENVGCPINAPLDFLDCLDKMQIPTTLRQVIIPTKNDCESNILALKEIAATHKVVDKIELLPFRKICQVKYDNMGLDFPFSSIPEPSKEQMAQLENLLK